MINLEIVDFYLLSVVSIYGRKVEKETVYMWVSSHTKNSDFN